MYNNGDKVIITGNAHDHAPGGISHHFNHGEICTVDSVTDSEKSGSLHGLGVTQVIRMTSDATGTFQTIDSRDCRPYQPSNNISARGLLKLKK